MKRFAPYRLSHLSSVKRVPPGEHRRPKHSETLPAFFQRPCYTIFISFIMDDQLVMI